MHDKVITIARKRFESLSLHDCLIAIALSLYPIVQKRHRTIALSCHHTIVIVLSRHRTIIIALLHHRFIVIALSCIALSTQTSMVRWCDSELHSRIQVPYIFVKVIFLSFSPTIWMYKFFYKKKLTIYVS